MRAWFAGVAPRFRWRQALPLIAGAVAIAILVGARIALPDPFERLRHFGFDALQRAYPRPLAAGAPVKVIDIDEESLRRHGQWPWSRDTMAALIRSLQDAGAAAIALDVVFAEPDRSSPARLAAEWRERLGPIPDPDSLPDHDRAFAAALARGRVVTGVGLLPGETDRKPAVKASFAAIGGDPVPQVPGFRGAVTNLPLLEEAAAGQGSFTVSAGRDEIIRSLPLLASLDGELVPSLALEALRVAQDEDTIRVRLERNGGPGGAVTGLTVRVGEVQIPLAADGSYRLHHNRHHAARTIPAWRLLDPAERPAAAAALGRSIALVGTSAVGLVDLRPTPLNPFEPGVSLHAGALEQILAGGHLTRPAWAAGAELSAALALGLLAAGVAGLLGLASGAALAAAIVAAALGGTVAAFTRAGVLVDPSLVLAAVLVGFVVASLGRYLMVERGQQKLRAAFSQYLSPDLVDQLARDPDRLRLGGEERDMTFLFTDLEGFTSFTETAKPEHFVALLNAYLDRLCAIAMAHGGTVDKIVGDAVHVMFNAPLDQPDHPMRAVRCALAIDAYARTFADEQRAAGVAFGVTRIGVNTGRAIVGNFGGGRRFDYTAHGDAINTAARLEAANKALGTRLCIARSTAERCADLAFRPVGALMLKGKSHAVDVFEPLGEEPAATDWLSDYRNAFAGLAAGDPAAPAALLALHGRRPDDPVLALHARRLQAGERSVLMAA